MAFRVIKKALYMLIEIKLIDYITLSSIDSFNESIYNNPKVMQYGDQIKFVVNS